MINGLKKMPTAAIAKESRKIRKSLLLICLNTFLPFKAVNFGNRRGAESLVAPLTALGRISAIAYIARLSKPRKKGTINLSIWKAVA